MIAGLPFGLMGSGKGDPTVFFSATSRPRSGYSVPAGIQAGDLLLLAEGRSGNFTPGILPSQGWFNDFRISTSLAAAAVAWRLLNGTEAGTVFRTQDWGSENGNFTTACMIVRPNGWTFSLADSIPVVTSGSLGTQTLLAGNSPTPKLCFAIAAGAGVGNLTTSLSPVDQSLTAANAHIRWAWFGPGGRANQNVVFTGNDAGVNAAIIAALTAF